ncbi:protein tipD [Dorcoceras hygrometricum]|uniref:Protein tipD n=1 Tax=Dorcoceras hygrometricum TaxID=472368 RepID=A0A2Z7AVA1_9LAMI|nr:protein tipD [Dorcoceras hygrometricum]
MVTGYSCNGCAEILTAESTSQLRASIDNIQFEKVQTRDSVDDLKDELSKKITSLELALEKSTSREEMVFRAQLKEVRREVQIQKATLTQELTAFRLETQEALLLFVLHFQKSFPISIEGVMTKMGKIVEVVRSLKIEADLEVVEVAEVNLVRKEEDHTKEDEAKSLVLVIGFLEFF